MFHKIMKGLAPAAALAIGTLVSGCNINVDMGGMEGVTLAELDTSGTPPTEINLVGPDNVTVERGDTFAVDVTGDDEAVAAVRFERDGDDLTIGRHKDAERNIGKATIRVTLPSLNAIAIAGSGSATTDHLDGSGEISIAGSGDVTLSDIAADSLDISIAGSGDVEGTGAANSLDASIAGSGSIKLGSVKVDSADISIAGSGDVAFASDGTVEASIVGSGDVDVTGSATCTVSALGSGKLRCSAGATEAP